MKPLKEILYKVALTQVSGSTDREISTVEFDSRRVQPNSLFVAIRGLTTNGHTFIKRAIELGAIAILCEKIPDSTQAHVTYLKVNDTQEALGIIAGNFYDHPSDKLKLIGITGTNGKTTCVTLLFKLFTELGYTCGLISTIENQIGDQIFKSNYTTPDVLNLNSLLNTMVEAGCEYCFMEVSSHAIVQRRIQGLNYRGGIFTNITHDHLDFHKTFDEYIKAKKTFFDGLGKDAFALSNADDRNGLIMLQNSQAHKKTYALKRMADFKGKLIENQFTGMLLLIEELEVWFKLVGEFNAYNLLAVYGTAMLLDQDKLKVLTLLSKLSGANGRFDYILGPNERVGIIDYAHTPDALINVLKTIKKIRKPGERIITLIGCGGDRDKTKRPEMARIACELSDQVILTSDNPRSEDPEQIIKDMEAGLKSGDRLRTLIIIDRREAIRKACEMAAKGDIILVAGKGHETYQEIKGQRYPFDDKEELTKEFINLKD